MNRHITLNELTLELSNAGVEFDRMSNEDLDLIKNVCDDVEVIVWLTKHSMMKTVFVNECGIRYYGIKRGSINYSELASNSPLIHPDRVSDVHKTIRFFTEYPDQLHKMTYLAITAEGRYEWTYMEARGVQFDQSGRPIYVLAVVYDIKKRLIKSSGRNKSINYAEVLERNGSLTRREKEILSLIATDLTSQEISERLFIEPSTVDTHRKHLIKKLGVKSSIGLVRYALLHSPY